MKFKEVVTMWLKEKSFYLKESTYALYAYEVEKYILPVLGEYWMEELTEECIQKVVYDWQNNGSLQGEPLKKSTAQNLVMLIKQILKFAAKKKYIKEYLLDIHFAPSVPSSKCMVFNETEQKQLIRAALKENSYKSFGLLLCISSGLRIGEICALKWSDINMSNKLISVSKTLQRICYHNEQDKTHLSITTPKTQTSIREIPLSNGMYEMLYQLPNINKDGYILTNTEMPMEPRSYRKYYDTFLRRNQLPDLNFHCLRHTFATRCIEQGADCKTVSELLGHSTIHTTMNMYVHPQMKEKRKCIEMVSWNEY